MSNPFENASAYFVLINSESQHSLWPQSIDIPTGWSAVYGPNDKANCLQYVEENWTDMRPKSLADATGD